MKNLKMITLLWIILIAWTLSGCFWDKDSDNENPNNIENMVQEDNTYVGKKKGKDLDIPSDYDPNWADEF